MQLVRPHAEQPHYGDHLGDAEYWRPYVLEVLDRHGLATAPLETPFVGTFPTFLAGDVVVKLFGPSFDGEQSHRVESAMHDLLSSTSIPAPAVVARGVLFDERPGWPYLVSERVRGRALREARATVADPIALAAELGEATAALHALGPPADVVARPLLDSLRHDAPARLRRFGLPDHLVVQVEPYLADAPPASVVVHADITADHVFVDAAGRLLSVIDWGDALVADRSYELPALFLDAFDGSRPMLDAFLGAARWDTIDFPRRALQGVLEFQFNAVEAVSRLVDLESIGTLDELAERLFG